MTNSGATNDDPVKARLAALERQVVMLRSVVVASAVLFAVGVMTNITSAQGPKTIQQRVEDLEKRIGGASGVEGTRLTAPFQVVDNTGKSLFRVTADAFVTIDGDHEKGPAVAMGRNPQSAAGDGFASFREGGGAALIGRTGKLRFGYHVMNAAGDDLASLSLSGDRPNLRIGGTRTGFTEIGVGDSNNAYMAIAALDGQRINLGTFEGSPLQVAIYNATKQRTAAMYADQTGGVMKVATAKGVAVGGLYAEASGGTLALGASSGGPIQVDLSAGSGGALKLKSAGDGTPRVALEAAGATGGVTAYNTAGEPVAILSSLPAGTGRLQLSQGPTVFVEAGVSVDGVGVVRTGPRSGGATGALAIPYQIVGRKD